MRNNKCTDFVQDPPMAFAIVQGSHDALKAAIEEMKHVLDGVDDEKATFPKLWKDYARAATVFMDIEEIDLFPLLEQLSPGCTAKTHLSESHVKDHELSYDIDEAISAETVDWTVVKQAFTTWAEAHLSHVTEEEILLPLTLKASPTSVGRCLVVHDKLIVPAEQRDASEFKYFVGYCVGKLSKFGAPQQPARIATKDFVRSLRSTCMKAQWLKYMPACRDHCLPEIWTELSHAFHVEDADDAHLVPGRIAWAILETDLDSLPRVKSMSPTPTPKHGAKSTKFPFPDHDASLQSSPEFYKSNCNCTVM